MAFILWFLLISFEIQFYIVRFQKASSCHFPFPITSIREETTTFRDKFLSEYQERDVDTNYSDFQQHVDDMLDKHVPTKLSSSRKNVPWLTPTIRQMCRKKQRLYNRAKKAKKNKDRYWGQYRAHQTSTSKALRKAKWDYINGILQESLKEGNSKPFWRYIYSQKNDSKGVAPLKEDGSLFTDSRTKAEILNTQFVSAFTRDTPGSDTLLHGPSYPPIRGLQISTKGVEKLLAGINPTKAAGPDLMPCRFMKELAPILAPILTAIFQQSMDTGVLPSSWLTAYVTPIFKKGSTCLPENYRPVSLTCVACKLLEHVICSHMRDHLDRQGILSTFQHGFRAMYSCETQLAVTIHDILNIRDRGIQSDIAILDFSKAFDKVPHKRLLGKLRLYGINDNILTWIESLLRGRTRVIIDGQFSSNSEVTSGVPQGTVLGPLLFLLYINDLPSVLQPSTKCRLFADDCLVYREIRSPEDQVSLQKDLDALEQWSIQWGMLFNAKKCNIMTVSRSTTPLLKFYQIDNTILDNVDSCTYLGILLTSDMSWSSHISSCAKKANARLGFLRRNLKGCPQPLKRMAYVSLVRSSMEYSSALWDPHLAKDKTTLENIQRRAARWIRQDYSSRSSVTAILSELGLDELTKRRQEQRLTLMIKIMHKLVAVGQDDFNLQRADSRTRASHSFKLRQQPSSTTELLHSFINKTTPEWNRLPAHMAEAGTLENFKSQLSASRAV